MRYIFITLLIANLGYFGYRYWLEAEQQGQSTQPKAESSNQDLARIRLLDEGPAGSGRKVLTAPAPVSRSGIREIILNPMNSQNQIMADGCPAVGPYQNLLPGQQSLEVLRSLELPVNLVAIDTESGDADYRVMIPPVNSLEEAYRRLRELQGGKIDSYVISEGEYALGISLGVFSQQNSASELQSDLRDSGYETQIVPVPRILREYWLIFDTDSSAMLTDTVFSRLLQIDSGVDRQFKPCVQG